MDGLITLLVMGYLIPLVGVPILFVKFSDQKYKLEELARTVLALHPRPRPQMKRSRRRFLLPLPAMPEKHAGNPLHIRKFRRI